MIVSVKPIRTKFPATITRRISSSDFVKPNEIIVNNSLDYDKITFYNTNIQFKYQKNNKYQYLNNTGRNIFWKTSEMFTYLPEYEEFEKPIGFEIS